MSTPTNDLTDLLERARTAKAEEDERAARKAASLERDNLRSDRQAAVTHVRSTLDLETDRDAWERLETPEDGIVDRAVVHPIGEGLYLGFRQRGVTAGGNVLVVMAPASDGALVASAATVDRLAVLPDAIEEARRRASEWSELLEIAEADHDGDVLAAAEATDTAPDLDEEAPRYRVEADDPGRLVVEALRTALTQDAR